MVGVRMTIRIFLIAFGVACLVGTIMKNGFEHDTSIMEKHDVRNASSHVFMYVIRTSVLRTNGSARICPKNTAQNNKVHIQKKSTDDSVDNAKPDQLLSVVIKNETALYLYAAYYDTRIVFPHPHVRVTGMLHREYINFHG